MKKIQNKLFLSGFISLLITATFQQKGYGQSVWMQDYKNNATWGVEFLAPSYTFGNDPRGFDFATYLFTNVPISDNWGLKLVFPISRYNGGGAKMGSGNPFLGFQYINRDTGVKFDFGARIPLIQSDDQIIYNPNEFGSLPPLPPSSVYNVGAFNDIITTVRYNINYRYGGETGWVYKIGQGLEVLAGTSGGAAALFNYYGQVLYKFDKLTVGGMLKGYHLTNDHHFLFPERNSLQFGLISLYDFGRFDFGLYLKKELISFLDDQAGIVFGFSFRISL